MLWTEERHGSFQRRVLGACLLEGGSWMGKATEPSSLAPAAPSVVST